MAYTMQNVPALAQRHVDRARLFADRCAMIEGLRPGSGGAIAEVGVAFGTFSEFLLDTLRPTRFVAIDAFRLHEIPEVWGKPISSYLDGMTHLNFYRQKFARRPEVQIESGMSYECLSRLPDQSLDMIYIDASHELEFVKRDAEQAVRKVKRDGTLIFNDYIMFDHLNMGPYGVVPVVNDLVVSQGWLVTGFALQFQMFCDIALRRIVD